MWIFFLLYIFGILNFFSNEHITYFDNDENIFLLKIRYLQIKSSTSSDQILGDETSQQEGRFKALILSLEWGSPGNPQEALQSICPLRTCWNGWGGRGVLCNWRAPGPHTVPTPQGGEPPLQRFRSDFPLHCHSDLGLHVALPTVAWSGSAEILYVLNQ